MIVWINGTHGSGKTATAAILRTLMPNSRVLDAEKVGEMWLHDAAEVIDTSHRDPRGVARGIADAVS